MQGVELVWYAVIGNFLVKELLYDAAARLYTVYHSSCYRFGIEHGLSQRRGGAERTDTHDV